VKGRQGRGHHAGSWTGGVPFAALMGAAENALDQRFNELGHRIRIVTFPGTATRPAMMTVDTKT
jgi:hypothetical protein